MANVAVAFVFRFCLVFVDVVSVPGQCNGPWSLFLRLLYLLTISVSGDELTFRIHRYARAKIMCLVIKIFFYQDNAYVKTVVDLLMYTLAITCVTMGFPGYEILISLISTRTY